MNGVELSEWLMQRAMPGILPEAAQESQSNLVRDASGSGGWRVEQNQSEQQERSVRKGLFNQETGSVPDLMHAGSSVWPGMGEGSWSWVMDRVISSCCAEGHQLILEVVEQLQQNRWSHSDVFGVHLALTEAVVNAIKHGNREDPSKSVYVACRVSPNRCWIEVRDEGLGFNPEKVPDCTLDENLDKPSGRGLKLMRNFMSMIEYHDCGRRLVMEKVLN